MLSLRVYEEKILNAQKIMSSCKIKKEATKYCNSILKLEL